MSAPEQRARVGYAAAAEHLGIKVTTLRALVCRKQVPHIRIGKRLVVFDLEQLDEWLTAKTVGAEHGR